ncbi:GNAT family N-acetyltransferase [Sungkyunkwania multivorans]|uniref:GNAT family N-acetyltransferase n=1 Tax=Sungkyunkwania multivorans TaxID=1173618 RepID=A0ABW3CYI5_9FLAO
MDYLQSCRELVLGSRLRRLSDRVMKEIQKVYDHFNIDFDPFLFPVMKIILDHEVVTTAEITKKLAVTQPATTQAINKLNKKGLLNIHEDKLDKRKKLVSLSPKGTALVSEMRPLWASIEIVVKQCTSHPSDHLIEHLEHFEQVIQKKTLSEQIIQMHHMTQLEKVHIIPFEPKYAADFRDLNVAWLEKYFVVEPHDVVLLEQCEETIVKKGGYIFFAKIGQAIAGCYSLIKVGHRAYELGKMAVSPEFQGKKIGQKLMQHCIEFSKQQGWETLMLYSNTKLENAIYIYRKFGFEEIELEDNAPYMRSNIKMQLTLQDGDSRNPR